MSLGVRRILGWRVTPVCRDAAAGPPGATELFLEGSARERMESIRGSFGPPPGKRAPRSLAACNGGGETQPSLPPPGPPREARRRVSRGGPASRQPWALISLFKYSWRSLKGEIWPLSL